MKRRHGFLAIPEDFLHFGPPSSAPAGEAHHSESYYPPAPSTWQGMIRTRLLEASRIDLADRSQDNRARIEALIGPPERLPSEWTLDGPWPAEVRNGQVSAWFHTPRWVHTDSDQTTWCALRPLDESACEGLISDHDGLAPLRAGDLQRSRTAAGFVSSELLLRILSGLCPRKPPEEAWTGGRLPESAKWESRPGLAVDEDLRAQDSLLYFLRAVRHQPASGLAGWLNAELPPDIPPDALEFGIFRGGRKARPLALQPLPPLHPTWSDLQQGNHLPSEIEDRSRVWLYLATPMYFEGDPCRPPIPSVGGVEVRVLAALLGKPVVVGGMVRYGGRGQAARVLENLPYVPPGSAWLVELVGGPNDDRIKTLRSLHNACALGRTKDRSFGFGRTFIGLPGDQT